MGADMHLIISQSGQIIGAALPGHPGAIEAPAGFDMDRAADYTLIDGVLQISVDAALRRIDADTDAITADVIGNRAAEYEEAERQAKAYADAGFTGPAPGMVHSWAVAKSWTDQVAAQDIIAQAAAYRGALETMRAQRLLRKEQVRTAPGAEARAQVMDTWFAFVSALRQQLGA